MKLKSTTEYIVNTRIKQLVEADKIDDANWCNIDEIDFVILINDIEEYFDITFDNNDLYEVETLDDLFKLIEEARK
jgi:acyl carrier protein